MTQESSVYPNIQDVALGYMILNGAKSPRLVEELGEEMFSSPERLDIFRGIRTSAEKYDCVSGVLISPHIDGRYHPMLYSIVGSVPENITWEAIKDGLKSSSHREICKKILRTLEEQIESGKDFDAAVQNFQDSFKKLRGPESEGSSLEDLLEGAASSITESKEAPQVITGITKLDTELGGLKSGTLYVVGAKTSHGKTATALSVAAHNLGESRRVLIASCENTEQLPLRLAALDSDIPLDWFVNPWRYVESKQKQAAHAVRSLEKYTGSLRILNNASITDIANEAEKLEPDIIIVDYLQRYAHRFSLSDKGRLSHEIGRLVSQFQDLGLDSASSLLLLSQLSRRNRDDEGRAPDLRDLKESGDIENYADVVLLPYWPRRDNFEEPADRYVISCRKNKLGPLFDAELKINLDTLRIE